MVFFHSMFSLELIALVAGVALLIYIKSQDRIKMAWTAMIAWVVIVLSSISILCSLYYAIVFWHHGPHHRCMKHKMERYEDRKDHKYMDKKDMSDHEMMDKK